MSTPVFLAVLAAAAMHASWNALLKMQGDRFIAVLLISFGMGVAALPLLPFVAVPRGSTWVWVAASICLQIGYKYFLTRAYETGDFAVAYPLARGAAPLLTTLGSVILLGEVPEPVAIMGIVLLCTGVVLMSVRRRGDGVGGRAVFFALVASGFIAAYTLADGVGARSAMDGISYIVWLFVLDGVASLVLGFALRGGRILPAMGREWKTVLGGGLLAALAYGIAVWAMTKAPIAAVAALRETSILFAMMLSVFLLGEKTSRRRVAAGVVIVAGVLALRLG